MKSPRFLLRCLGMLCCLGVLTCVSSRVSPADTAKPQVLVISVTKGFQHSSIPLGEEIVAKLGSESGLWLVDFARTDDDLAKKTTATALRRYKAVVFNNSSGDLPMADRKAFLDWVKAGGGVVGIHAATDSFKIGEDPSQGWADYIDMMGGQFATHGPQSEVEFLVQDSRHPATRDLPARYKATEEVYLFSHFSRDKVRVLIALDKHPNTGIAGDYPISWVRNYGKGRVFYTALGHREDLLESDYVQKHLLGGVKWALGLASGNARPLPPRAPLSLSERREGFRALFNGKDLTGWHVRNEGRKEWVVQNGMLIMPEGGGSDLVTDETFEDVVVRYEYMVPKGGNSGFYVRGRYEIQVFDDYEQGNPESHGNGAIYGKIAPTQFASRPAGEWQTAEVKLVGNRVTVVLNGVKIIDDQPIDGPTGGALDGNVDQPGPMMLQGDHGPIAYRNIRIKTL